MNGKSFNILKDNLKRLKQLFPELFSEEKLDWERLKAFFSEDINFANERYVLNWAGKSDAFKTLQMPTTAALKPIPEESVRFSETENVFIEGENLEVLKVLQKSYYGKIKCIIIDPPYNTGSDSFIYPDKFSEKKENYLKRVGDTDEEGLLMKEGLFRKNSKENGQYHSNWLSMMYPRLYLAKNLLRDDGVIFVHIDDNEVHNLRLIMNEIYGEENIIAQVIWHGKYTTSNDAKYISGQHESILVYAKVLELFNIGLLDRTMQMDDAYKNPDRDPRGRWKATPLHAKSGSKTYEITFENGVTWHPPKGRYPAFTKEKLLELYSDNRISFGKDGKSTPNLKTFLTEVKQGKTVSSIWTFKDVGSTHEANEELASLISKGIFENPKPCNLSKRCIKVSNANLNDIVLDFFAGSATTAHAVMESNKEDGGNRKFILVQLPEPCDETSEAYKAGYKTIAEIAKERIRRVIKKIEKEKSEKPDLFEKGKLDLGFKVFKLTPSNFKIWRSAEITGENLESQLNAFVAPAKEGSEKENILYELMLKAGCTLTDSLEYVITKNPEGMTKQSDKVKKKEIASVTTLPRNDDNIGYYKVNNGELIIALDAMNKELVETIIEAKPKKVITLDSLFTGNDQLKTNTVLQMKDAGIEFRTV